MSDVKAMSAEAIVKDRREELEASMSGVEPKITDPLAQQAAAMMVEDARTFIQAFEQVTIAATAKATALALRDPTAGDAVLKAITEQQNATMAFAKEVVDLATQIRTSFRDPA